MHEDAFSGLNCGLNFRVYQTEVLFGIPSTSVCLPLLRIIKKIDHQHLDIRSVVAGACCTLVIRNCRIYYKTHWRSYFRQLFKCIFLLYVVEVGSPKTRNNLGELCTMSAWSAIVASYLPNGRKLSLLLQEIIMETKKRRKFEKIKFTWKQYSEKFILIITSADLNIGAGTGRNTGCGAIVLFAFHRSNFSEDLLHLSCVPLQSSDLYRHKSVRHFWPQDEDRKVLVRNSGEKSEGKNVYNPSGAYFVFLNTEKKKSSLMSSAT